MTRMDTNFEGRFVPDMEPRIRLRQGYGVTGYTDDMDKVGD